MSSASNVLSWYNALCERTPNNNSKSGCNKSANDDSDQVTLSSRDISLRHSSLGSPCSELTIPAFDPKKVTVLEISDIGDAVSTVFQTGCLPNWLRHFASLQILKAAKCGLLIVEPWLVELTELQEIYFEQNLIATWPHFLRDLPALSYICLDGNPCLEKAFCKSPSLRSLVFNWGPSKDAYKTVPRYIRGPEWPAAATARTGISANMDTFGSYFGGIYTLSTPPDCSNEGCLTPLEPCPLQTRILSSLALPTSQGSRFSTCGTAGYIPHELPDAHKMRQSKILFTIFDDIHELLHRNKCITATRQQALKRQYVPITGSVEIRLAGSESEGQEHLIRKRDLSVYAIIRELLKEEEHFCVSLRLAIKEFYSSNINSSSAAIALSRIFEWFPKLLRPHQKQVLPMLKLLATACSGRSQITVTEGVNALCRSLKQAQTAYEWYARRLNVSECYLDMPSSCAGLYRDPELQEHVRRQLMKLGGMNAYLAIQFSNGSTMTTIEYINRRKSTDALKPRREVAPAAEWATKELRKPKPKISKHPSEYMFLPLFHIVRYERVFTVLSYLDSRFGALKSTCREIRRHVAYRRREALTRARSKLLTSKFRVGCGLLTDYRWDAVLGISSRSYLEKGLMEPKTNDVIDVVLNEPASFVTETFDDKNQRLVRLICCGGVVQIWDEVFESMVTSIGRDRIRVRALPESDKIRIVFPDVREVCLVTVKEFSAPYITLKTDAEEFVQAFEYDKYMF